MNCRIRTVYPPGINKGFLKLADDVKRRFEIIAVETFNGLKYVNNSYLTQKLLKNIFLSVYDVANLFNVKKNCFN